MRESWIVKSFSTSSLIYPTVCPSLIQQARITELGTRAKGQRLGQLRDLDEDPARSILIDRWLAWTQLEVKPPGGRQSVKRIRAWLALPAHIGVDD